MTMPHGVRRADLDDVPTLLCMLRDFAAAYGTKQLLFPTDAQHAITVLEALITTQVVFVAEMHGHVVGLIAGTYGPHLFNPELRTLAEVFWWVDPPFRGTNIAGRLLYAFIDFGKASADWVIMTLEAHSPALDEALKTRGFIAHERSFLLEVQH